MNEFSKLLNKFRKDKRLSQRALANVAEVDQSYLNRLERGLRNPPKKRTILAIIKALDLGREDTLRLLQAAGLPNVQETTNQEKPPRSLFSYSSSLELDDPNEHTLEVIRRIINDPDIPLEKRKQLMQDLERFARWLHDDARKDTPND